MISPQRHREHGVQFLARSKIATTFPSQRKISHGGRKDRKDGTSIHQLAGRLGTDGRSKRLTGHADEEFFHTEVAKTGTSIHPVAGRLA